MGVKYITRVGFGATLLATAASCGGNNEVERPNIILAIADDATWMHWRAYQNENSAFVNTPAFDRVASEGVLFENCYTCNPKSAPSRAVLLTGRNSWQLEEAANHCSLFPSKFDTYPDILARNGYHVGYTGKGWAPGSWKEGGRTINPAGEEYNDVTFDRVPTKGISKKDYVGNFKDFLNGREAGQPFCFWLGTHEPHRPYQFGSSLESGKSLEDAEVLPLWVDNEIVRTDILDYALEIEWFDAQIDALINYLEEIGELEKTMIIVTADNGMSFPACKGQLFETGVHLPLAIMWKGHMCEGREVSDFISFRDIAPTILEVANILDGGDMSGKSIVPQLKSRKSGWIDSDRNYCTMGRELHDGFSYPVRAIKQDKYLYVRNYQPDESPDRPLYNCYEYLYNGSGEKPSWLTNYPTDQQVLKVAGEGDTFYYTNGVLQRPAEMLFDTSVDPYCLNNLAEDAGFDNLMAQLSEKLDEELHKDEDPRILGNGDIFATYPFLTK